MSPYALALRAALLSPGSKASAEVRALLSLDPPNFRGAPEAWRDAKGEPGDAFRVTEQIRRWIAGKVACRVERWQPPGYVPPPKHSGPKARPWHPLAGTAPDAEVAAASGVTAQQVARYRWRVGIPAFKPNKPSGQEPPHCGACGQDAQPPPDGDPACPRCKKEEWIGGAS